MFNTFANRKTDSDAKRDNEYQLYQLCTSLQINLKNSSVVTLVGHYSGLKRHYELYKPFFKHIYVAERCPIAAAKLQRQARRLNIANKVTIIFGDFFDVVKDLQEKGIRIGCLDFDGVEQIGKNEDELTNWARKMSIPIVVYVGSSRGQSAQFREWCKKKGKRKTLNHYHQLRYELKRLGPEYMRDKARGYSTYFRTYKGVTNMFECVMVEKQFKTNLLEVYSEKN